MIDAANSHGCTALHAACEYGEETMVLYLLRANANARATTSYGDTALHMIVQHPDSGRNNREHVICALLYAGADINAMSNEGVTPLMLVIISGSAALTSTLMHHGADIILQNPAGENALYLAVKNKNEMLVKMLIDAGADVNIPSHIGKSSLQCACQEGDDHMVAMLLTASARSSHGVLFNGVLLEAVLKGSGSVDFKLAMLRFCVKAGVRIDSPEHYGNTALVEYSDDGHFEIVELLIQAGARLEALDSSGRTALFRASSSSHIRTVKLLLDKGAPVDIPNLSGITALMGASRSGSSVTVDLLLNAGAQPNIVSHKTGYVRTAFFETVKHEHIEVVRLLLDAGADVDALNGPGDSALFEASSRGYPAIVLLLLSKEAQVDKTGRTDSNETPLWAASKQGHDFIVTLLLDAGACVNVEDDNSPFFLWSPALLIAHMHGHQEVTKILQKAGAQKQFIPYWTEQTVGDGRKYDTPWPGT